MDEAGCIHAELRETFSLETHALVQGAPWRLVRGFQTENFGCLTSQI